MGCGISGAALMFMVVFMLETLLRSSAPSSTLSADTVVLVIFYATAVICFPLSDGTATAGISDDDGGGTCDAWRKVWVAPKVRRCTAAAWRPAQSLRKWIKTRGGGGVECAGAVPIAHARIVLQLQRGVHFCGST